MAGRKVNSNVKSDGNDKAIAQDKFNHPQRSHKKPEELVRPIVQHPKHPMELIVGSATKLQEPIANWGKRDLRGLPPGPGHERVHSRDFAGVTADRFSVAGI